MDTRKIEEGVRLILEGVGEDVAVEVVDVADAADEDVEVIDAADVADEAETPEGE